MIYLILISGLTIVLGLITILNFILWRGQLIEPISSFFSPPIIIEKVYRGKDFMAAFDFMTKEDMLKEKLYGIYQGREKIIVLDSRHKEYLIKKFSQDLVEQMFKNNCIEMREEELDWNPFMKRVYLMVKVYQPEIRI